MNEFLAFWSEGAAPTVGSATVAWSLLLAVAAVVGYLVRRYTGLPKVAGYSVVGAIAGFFGFTGVVWPLQGNGLFLLELGVAVVLFEAGARISLRWFRHNPMVLVQSLLESAATFAGVYWLLSSFGLEPSLSRNLAIVSMVASPAVLTRVVMDSRASGPVTERALTLSTLNTLYALTLGTAMAGLDTPHADWLATMYPIVRVFGMSIMVAAIATFAMRSALRVMSPTSENTSMLLLALIAAGAASAASLGGSAALAALLTGMLLKQLHPRPWIWPRQLGTAGAMLTMLMFVLVSTAAAQAPWQHAAVIIALALVVVRAAAKIVAVSLASFGSGLKPQQALWVGCAMSPMSSVALLLTSVFATASPALAMQLTAIALPAILLMEVLGGFVATVALTRAGEAAQPWIGVTPSNSKRGELA
ncbi:cation:proton antiporter [Variovorax sp. HJSM1_2]|uniref:cation:proton antiporter n=1 Tax=Variovorax sp. HJSM1_2 TaxID=3366263 RepID=UPI003BED9F61